MRTLQDKERPPLKICVNCVLPESFPGVKFNNQGVCHFCLGLKDRENQKRRKKKYREKFEKLLAEHRGKGAYDVLLSYSGGKDSTYTLLVLKQDYGLRTLAFSMDNGFVPEQTYRNIRTVCERLGIDHLWLKPDFQMLRKVFRAGAEREIYPRTVLMRASTICTSCMTIVRFSALRLALDKRIPFIVFGWSPGQIPLSASVLKYNPETIKAIQSAGLGPIRAIAGEALGPYFLREAELQDAGRLPYNISPLAFLDYDERTIRERIERLDWKDPAGLDANSTNCLLNSFANIVHENSCGHNPYVFELAALVREGYLRRSEALERLRRPSDPETVRCVKKKLGL